MDNSPTALFDSYEQDFQQILKSVRDRLDSDDKDGGEQKNASLRRLDMELDEADEMVSQMEIELQGVPTTSRTLYQTRLKTSKADLSRYKKLVKDMQSKAARSDLLSRPGDVTSDEPYGLTSDRSRLLAGTALLDEGTRRLQESHRIALETENLGGDILMDLRTQREQIEHSRDTLHVADSSIDRASNTLKKMIRRMYQQRVVTIAIIVILILLISVITWEKFS